MRRVNRNSSRPNLPRHKKPGVQAKASHVTMEVDIPGDLVSAIIGKGGSNKKQLESATGAQIRVQPPQIDGQQGVVIATGTQEQVDSVFKKVQAEVAKRSEALAKELEPRFKGLPSLGNNQGGSQDDGLVAQKELNTSQWTYEDMEADIAISASALTFICLVGRKGKNITKIREECDVNIKVQDRRGVKETQHAYISGRFNEAISAARMVKESLETYDPELDHSAKKGHVNKMDLKSIKAEAKCKIIGQAMGFLVGKGRYNLKRMKEETNYEDLDYDKEVDEEGFITVRISGYVHPVLEALSQIYLSMKWWCEKRDELNSQPDATEEQQCMTTTSNAVPNATHPTTGVEMANEMSSTTLQQHSSSLPADSQGVEPPPEPVYCFQDRNGFVLTFEHVDGNVYKRIVHKNQQLDPGPPPGFGISGCPQQQRTPMISEAMEVVRRSLSQTSYHSAGPRQRESSRRTN